MKQGLTRLCFRLDVESLYPIGQRRGLDLQQFGGTSGTGNTPIGRPQRRDQIAPLQLTKLAFGQEISIVNREIDNIRQSIRLRRAEIQRKSCSAAQYHGAFHHVLEFTYVARPAPALELPCLLLADRQPIAAEFVAEAIHAVNSQRENVGLALPQGRDRYREYAQPVIKVLPESTRFNLGAEVPVGSGNNANIDRDGPVVTDRFELVFLKYAQQLALKRQRNLADLVQEQRAAVGELHAPDPVAMGAGERALDVTEELAFEQVLGHRGAVDPDQGTIAAIAGGMDGPGDHFLAHAGLAQYQHAHRRCGDRLDLRQGVLERRALADDFAEIHGQIDLLAQVVALELELPVEFADPVEGLVALLLDLLPGRYVAKDHDRAVGLAAFGEDGRAGVLDLARVAVAGPEHLIVDTMHLAVLDRRVDRTIFARVRRAIGVRVMMHFVHAPADNIVKAPTQQVDRSPVGESAVAVAIETVDALAGRLEDQLKPLLDRFDFGMRLLSRPLGFEPPSDVAKHDHRTGYFTVAHDRRAGVLDRNRLAVVAPEDFVVDSMNFSVSNSGIDRTILGRVRTAVRIRMMVHIVKALADDVVRLPAKQVDSCAIGERGASRRVNSVNAVTGGIEDGLVSIAKLVESTFQPVAFRSLRNLHPDQNFAICRLQAPGVEPADRPCLRPAIFDRHVDYSRPGGENRLNRPFDVGGRFR